MNGGYTVDIASPKFPCGAAWLANALIELNVRLDHLWGFDTAGEWRQETDGSSTYCAIEEPWRQTLASLRPGRSFRFRDDIRPRFSHAFPWQKDLAPAVVLVIRDPRDALYSEWQRHRRNLHLPQSVTFPQFVEQSFFEGPISVINMLWLHMRAWLRFAESHSTRTYVLRFEDFKSAPEQSLRKIARWLNLHPIDSKLAIAAESSDVRHLQRIERTLKAADPSSRQFNRKGAVEEWRETWHADWHTLLGPHWQPVFAGFQYPPGPTWGTASFCTANLSEILAWRGLTDLGEVKRWRELIHGP